MKFSTSILSNALLASTVLASPTPPTKDAHTPRLRRRSGGARALGNSPMNTKESSNTKSKFMSSVDTTSDVTYSTNWGGAVYSDPPSGETFNAVSASFIVPTPSVPSGVDTTDGEYAASIWVGIDGYTASTAILQTGIDVVVSSSGEVSFDSWYEWYPESSYYFDLDISAGDNVTTSVTATSTTTGVATIENVMTGKTATISLNSTSALEGQNAEWIVEDFEENDALVAFADFGNVTFTNCVASTSSSSEGVTDATVMDLETTSDEVLTTVDILSSSSFLITYNATTTTTTGSSGSGSGSGFGGSPGGMDGGFGSRDSTNTTTSTSAGDRLNFSSWNSLMIGGSTLLGAYFLIC